MHVMLVSLRIESFSFDSKLNKNLYFYKYYTLKKEKKGKRKKSNFFLNLRNVKQEQENYN